MVSGWAKPRQLPGAPRCLLWGSRAISAAYSGDSVYNGAGDTLTQTISTPAGATGPLTINTTGPVELYAPSSGQYGELTIFQDRTVAGVITLSPGNTSTNSVVPDCPGGFMTADLSGYASRKSGCGANGGLRGAIYAASDDALVMITKSGLAFLQVMAGQIEIDSDADVRFGFNAPYFVNGGVHLVE